MAYAYPYNPTNCMKYTAELFFFFDEYSTVTY